LLWFLEGAIWVPKTMIEGVKIRILKILILNNQLDTVARPNAVNLRKIMVFTSSRRQMPGPEELEETGFLPSQE